MKRCVLTLDPNYQDPDPNVLIVHWAGWLSTNKTFSLPKILAAKFLQIRQEHTAWAWEMAKLPILGEPLAQLLAPTDHPSMWWCSLLYERHPKMTPVLYTLYLLRALEIFLDEKEITHLTFIGQDKVVAHALANLAQETRRTFTFEQIHLPSPKPSILKLIYQKLPAKVRAIVRLIHWYLTIKRKITKAPIQKGPNQTATIVTYFPNIDLKAKENGRFISKYWEGLHKLLNDHAKKRGEHFVRWLFIRFPAPQMTLDQCVSFRDTLNEKGLDGLSFNYLEEFLSPKDIWACFKNYIFIARQSQKIAPDIKEHFHLPNSKLNFWHLFKPDYQETFQGYRSLERCLQSIGLKNYLDLIGCQKWFLFPQENCPWERMLAYHAQKNNLGPTIGAQHSTVRPTDLRYFDDPRSYAQNDLPRPTIFLANGQSAASQWQNAGMPKDAYETVEALRYAYLANLKRLAPKPLETLLVLTSFFTDETSAHMRLFLQAYQSNLLNGLKIILKPHPYLALDPYLPKNHGFTIGKGHMQDYFQSGTLVWASNSTTAALEAAIMGLPLAVMLPENDFDLCPIQDLPDLLRTGTLDDVKAMLRLEQGTAIPYDYLCLNANLSLWKSILKLN